MAIKAVLENLENLDENLKGLYRERDGVHVLDVEGAEDLVDISGLKSALDKERKARREAEGLAKQFEGIDPREHRRLLETAVQAQEEQAVRDGQWDKFKKVLESKHARTREKLEQELTEVKKANFTLVAEGGLTETLLAAGVRKELLPFAKSYLLPRVEILNEGGSLKAVIGETELPEYVSAWAQTPEGMATIAAPDNQGGGGGRPAGTAALSSDLAARLTEARRNRDTEAVMRLETAIFNQRRSLGQ